MEFYEDKEDREFKEYTDSQDNRKFDPKDYKVEFSAEETSKAMRQRLKDKINFKSLAMTNYLENMRLFHQIQPFFFDKNRNFWFWNHESYKYELVDETDVVKTINHNLNLSSEIVSSGFRSSYLEAFKQVGRASIPLQTKKTWVQFKDTIVDIDTDEHIKASPEYFMTNPIPHKLGTSTETPNIDRVFEQWVGKPFVRTLYEILAYCLLPDYPVHRLFVLHGAGMNGKGKYLELLCRFIGYENRTSTELDLLMTNRFEVTKLYKKLACIIGETNFNTMTKTSLLKRLTGGDTIGFEHKNKNPFDDYNYAKIIIATNSLPVTMDKTMGFYRRFLIIDFPNRFTEKKDILGDIPDTEYQNLSAKCIKILGELLDVREFTNEGTVEDREAKYENLSNPLQRFIKERTEEDINAFVYKWEFLQEMKVFCKTHGYRVLDDTEIGKYMKNYGFDTKRKMSPDGNKQWYCFFGIKLSGKTDTSILDPTLSEKNSHGSEDSYVTSTSYSLRGSKSDRVTTLPTLTISSPQEMEVGNFPDVLGPRECARILDIVIDDSPKEIENIIKLLGEHNRKSVDIIIQAKLSVGAYFSPKQGQVRKL